MPPEFTISIGTGRKTRVVGWLLLGWLAVARLNAAADTNSPVVSANVITNMAQYWTVAVDPAEGSQVHRARMEVTIYYADPLWHVHWGASDGASTYLPFRGMTNEIASGARILVDGLTLPVNQEFYWDKTTVTILSTTNSLPAVAADGKLNNTALKSEFVEFSALVDSVQTNGQGRLRLGLLADDMDVDAVIPITNGPEVGRAFAGKMIHIRGVYSPTFGPFGKLTQITVWTPSLAAVDIIGTLEDDPRFAAPILASESFQGDSPKLVRVRGEVRSQQPGESVTIWDDTGQIRILAKQRNQLQRGERIEAVGYPAFEGLDRILRMGLFRVVTNSMPEDVSTSTNAPNLRLADQVRGLDQGRIARNPKVSLQGIVTGVDPRGKFIFLQDSSGGIRVAKTALQTGRSIRPGMMITVAGVAAMGDFAPVITNAEVRQTGTMVPADPPLITLEEALTGTEDGNWIQMRGFIRKAVWQSDGMELLLVAPGGEFTAHVRPDDAVDATKGAVVFVRGVCLAIANARHELTGIELWSSAPGAIQTEQAALSDPFVLPERPLGSLRQFNLFNTLNERVHTAGTVTLYSPGRYVVLQEGDASLLALSDQTEPLQPGDRVEIVGFSGRTRGDFVLRQAEYRRLAAGQEPAAVTPATLKAADENLDGLLVSVTGTLSEVVHEPGETHLVMQSKGHVFEAKIESPSGPGKLTPEPGSRLALTGVYRIERDESGKALSFVLNLRNGTDIRVVSPPPWWTVQRVIYLSSGLVPVLLLGGIWAMQMRRKNRQLERAQVNLKTAHNELEERVASRTRELNEEVEARKRALERLNEAQQTLIRASRQAGMAEVATGILHNVGNILNSVNVSAGMIDESLQRLRIDKFVKASELLGEYENQLNGALAQDPRGRALPGYLRQLSANMKQNEQVLRTEVKSLVKQVDHVKAVVAWQQDHARSSGFYEKLDAAELMEDALRINHAGFQREGITVVKEFLDLPPLVTDRHKVLQILINVLRNARQAMAGTNAEKRVTLRIQPVGDGMVRFEVSDSGQGISPENLERIFSLGFTTKPEGHGFGLHSAATSAQEMGGRLFAQSAGPGCGATFILELPTAPKPERRVPMEVKSL